MGWLWNSDEFPKETVTGGLGISHRERQRIGPACMVLGRAVWPRAEQVPLWGGECRRKGDCQSDAAQAAQVQVNM